MSSDVKQKWIVEGEDRTRPAFNSLKKNVSGVDKAVASMQRNLSGGLQGMLAGLTVGAAYAVVDRTADSLDNLAEKSRQLGMTSPDLDAWRYAAELGGVSADEFDAAAGKFSASMAAAADASDYGKTAFGQLGVEVKSSADQFRTIPDVLLDVADSIAAVEDPVKRVAMAREMFGRGGERFITVTEGGSTAIREWLTEAYAMGTRTDAMTAKGEAFNDSQQRLRRSIRNTSDAIATEAIPILAQLAETISLKVINAVTGLDDEFRSFIGSLSVMPDKTAVEVIAAREAELLAERGRLLDEDTQATARWEERSAIGNAMGSIAAAFGAEGGWAAYSSNRADMAKRVMEINRQLAALGNVSANVKARTDALAQSEEDLRTELERDREAMAAETAAREAAAETTRHMTDLRREAEKVVREQMTAEELLAESQAKLDEMLAAGLITTQQWTQAMRELAPEIDRVAKANNELAEQAEKANNTIDESLSNVQVAGLDAVDSMRDNFDEFFKFGEEGFLDLGRLAESVMDDIAEAAYRNMIINPLLSAVSSAITGGGGGSVGGSSTIGTGSNNSLGVVNRGFSGGAGGGSPVLTPVSGGTTVVQLTINAVDAPGVQQLLIANKGLITGLVQENYTRRGVAGPRGVR